MKTYLSVNETDIIYKRMPLDTKEEGHQSPPTTLQQLTYTPAINLLQGKLGLFTSNGFQTSKNLYRNGIQQNPPPLSEK